MKRIICDICQTQCDCGKCKTKEPERYKCDLKNGECELLGITKSKRCRQFCFDVGRLCFLEDKAYWRGHDKGIREL